LEGEKKKIDRDVRPGGDAGLAGTSTKSARFLMKEEEGEGNTRSGKTRRRAGWIVGKSFPVSSRQGRKKKKKIFYAIPYWCEHTGQRSFPSTPALTRMWQKKRTQARDESDGADRRRKPC